MSEEPDLRGVTGDAAIAFDDARRALIDGLQELFAALVPMNAQSQAVARVEIHLARCTNRKRGNRVSD